MGNYKMADESKRCSARVKAESDGKWRLSVKVANTMNTVLTEADGKMTAGPVMSTMMPVPDLEELEKEVSGMLNNLTDIRMEGSDLVLEGDGKSEKFILE